MPKKILFYYSVLNVGGAENSLLRMMHLLAEHGWEVAQGSAISAASAQLAESPSPLYSA